MVLLPQTLTARLLSSIVVILMEEWGLMKEQEIVLDRQFYPLQLPEHSDAACRRSRC